MSSGTVLRERAIINDCYILRQRVGRDAYCEIWRASALFSATNFLLRFVDDTVPTAYCEAERRLILDAYDVRHAAILDVVEVDRYGQLMFISSEYNDLVTLEQAMSRGTRFSLDHICGFVLELSQALDMFNRRGLVYGTLNMQSIFVSLEQGVVTELKLLKPGYLPLVGAATRQDSDAMRCNYGFMAPECKSGAAEAPDQRADVYSLGILLYRLISGAMPFRGEHAGRALDAPVSVGHVSNALIRRDIPPALARIIVNCVRTNPALRYPNMVGLIRELRMFLDDRRLATIRRGAADPLADLEKLNTARIAGGAEQVLRKLDMAEYFGALSDGGAAAPEPSASLRFPPVAQPGTAAGAGVDEPAEVAEMGQPDQDSRSAQDYVDASLRLFGRAVPGRAVASAASSADASTPTGVAAGPGAGAGADQVASAEASLHTHAALPSQAGARVLWSRLSIEPEALGDSLVEACESARRKRGAFRYIEEPRGEQGRLMLSELEKRMRQAYLVLDLATGFHTIDALVQSMRAAFEASLRDVSPAIRRRLRLRFPPVLESIASSLDHEAAALALCGLATRSRPLVVLLRVSAPLDPGVAAFLEALATIAHRQRVCVFAFFSGEPPVA